MQKKECNANIQKTIDLAEEMIRLATKGDAHREDPGCGILYGVLLDSGYKILNLAREEKQRHISKGTWKQLP